jgi:AraC-like DNA-binding protein
VPQLKTYTSIDKNAQNLNFAVSKMSEVYQRRNGTIDELHRHDFYTILVIKRAKGKHVVDFNTYILGERQIFFLAPGQVHQLVEHQASEGYVLTFSTEFLIENSIAIAFVESLNLFNNYGHSPALVLEQDKFEDVFSFCAKMFRLQQSEDVYKTLSIGAYLKLLLIECNSSCTLNALEPLNFNASQRLIKDFKALVEQHYKSEHSTHYYAEQLHISPDYLNRKIKSHIGKTSKEYIQSRIVTEAKRLICFSELTYKEIGFELGFAEPSNFSHFFKNCTGQSPSVFKNSLKTV